MADGRNQQPWRVIDLINWGTEYFAEKGFEQPRQEIEGLLGNFLNCKRIDLYLRFEEPLTKPILAQFRSWVKRRVNHEPLQYIAGRTEFYDLELTVNPAVLIPRPETERLVELALELLPKDTPAKVLDVGTGSGCIAVALAKNRPLARVAAIDNSLAALAVARVNGQKHDLPNIEFIQMDFLHAVPEGRFDLIVSNPPYVPQAEMEKLMPEVGQFEPAAALTDRSDGLVIYRRLAEVAPKLVQPNGWLLLEVGLGDHPQKAQARFAVEPFNAVELIKDYNGDDRVLKVEVGKG